jgi:hypothetical protein
MQIDVFALLSEARQRLAANIAAIEAQRDFWLAHTDLSVAVVAGSPAGDAPSSANLMPATAESPGH